MTITVFTPTFNRATLLPRLYESLVNQTFLDFEWLIVDDGSTDDTFNFIESIKENDKIDIQYYYQNNAGKHAAINWGVELANGDLFLIVDSDEVMIESGLQTIVDVYKQVSDNDNFAGVTGLKSFFSGKTIGGELNYTYLDCSAIDYNLKYKYGGEMAVAYRTKILQKYPFPIFEGEKYCGEGLIWYKIALHYKLRYFAHPIILTEYYPDGLTALGVNKRMESPKTTLATYSELSKMNVPFNSRIRYIINFWRFFCCDKQRGFACKLKLVNKSTILLFPLGYCLHLIDIFKTKRR